MKQLLEKILKTLTQSIIRKYAPEIIGITGSVGKTTTKKAIYTVLATTYNVRANIKNYNNEIGIPLSVIGMKSGNKSLVKWLFIFFKALRLIIFKDKNYPDILVLEMGADKPGDIAYLTELVPVKVGVVTAVAEVHIEFFENLDHIAKEKGNLIRALPENGYAVLNADDAKVLHMGSQTKAEVVTYGHGKENDYVITDKENKNETGLSFTVKDQDGTMEVHLPKLIGKHFTSAILTAIAVGKIYSLDIISIIKSLQEFQPPNGRMRLLDGIKKTLIIDDTYNSSPLAAGLALDELARIKGQKKYAVLGDMLELGKYAEQSHQDIGKKVAQLKIDYLITAGELARDFARGAKAAGMNLDHIFSFKDSIEAGRFLQKRMKPGDVILAKGSQGARMERVVKEVMARPEHASDLLVRQDKPWR